MLKTISTLGELNQYIEEFNASFYPESNLKPIVGGGLTTSPEIAFIFINPTKRNIASDPNWEGLRVPWVGFTTLWGIFYKAGLISQELFGNILHYGKSWTPEFTEKVYLELAHQGYYLTNIVKWAGEDAALPEKSKIQRYLPILKKELEIVKPKRIVAFGSIPFNALTGNNDKLQNFYDFTFEHSRLKYLDLELEGFKTKITPCYFPVGMGRFKEKEAVEILKLL